MSKSSNHATSQQILAAFNSLTASETLVLKRYAYQFLDGTRFSEPLDLIHEALGRSLDGRRNWPMNIAFSLYLALAMRSIADGDRNRIDNTRGAFISIDEAEAEHLDEMPRVQSVEDDMQMLDRLHETSVLVESVKASLVDDPTATLVLDCLVNDMSPLEICARHGISEQKYDSARHKIVRRFHNIIKSH